MLEARRRAPCAEGAGLVILALLFNLLSLTLIILAGTAGFERKEI